MPTITSFPSSVPGETEVVVQGTGAGPGSCTFTASVDGVAIAPVNVEWDEGKWTATFDAPAYDATTSNTILVKMVCSDSPTPAKAEIQITP